MAYVGETPWHGLGKRVEKSVTSKEMCVAAGLAQRVDLSDQLGFDLKDKASLPGLFLTAAMARQPDAVILISSNDPARIKSNVSSIELSCIPSFRRGRRFV